MSICADEKISVIIPVYNVQKYVGACLDSILGQTYSNFEVICIDDGSPDASGEICEAYQKKDDRVRVYHIENHGVSYARNYGLSLMRGEWFCFVDPDDWVEPNYLERMYALAVEKQCDIVACGVDKTYEHGVGSKESKETVYTFETSKECIKNYICGENSMHGYSCNKLYSSKKFGDVRFDTALKVNEDCIYIYEIMSGCERACFTTMPLYHWYIRPDSACHRRAKTADFGAANVFLRLYDKLQDKMDDETMKTLKRNYVSSVVQVLLFAKLEKGNNEVVQTKNRCKEWKKDVWSSYCAKQKMKYLYAVYFRSYSK